MLRMKDKIQTIRILAEEYEKRAMMAKNYKDVDDLEIYVHAKATSDAYQAVVYFLETGSAANL